MLKQWLKSIVEIVFPRECVCCGEWLIAEEEGFCLTCDLQLPRTKFILSNQNPVAEVFYGRIPITSAASFLWLNNANITRRIIHSIKYKGNKNLAFNIGKKYATEIIATQPTIQFDFIVPVPLHAKKLKFRGYNQAEEFANGLQDIWKTAQVSSLVKRKHFTQTQTKKNRISRWENVAEIFECLDESIANKHVLVVDDVITTGATIEATCIPLLKYNPASIHILSIAFTKD